MREEAIQHVDEARTFITKILEQNWDSFGAKKILIIEDAFGRFTLGVWGDRQSDEAILELLHSVAPFGAESWFHAPQDKADFDPMDLDSSWDEANSIDETGDWDDRIRQIVRHRMLPAWQRLYARPLLRQSGDSRCPVVAFYSFKGGMGRSTALSLFALDRARHDQHVVVVDLDIDAPGLGTILSTDSPSQYGVVDYLLERPLLGRRPRDLRDYYYTIDLGSIRSTGSLKVIPAGRLDDAYLGKMARLDFEPVDPSISDLRHPLEELLLQISDELHPDWILLDSRTGFSETAGMLLSGICDYHVLFGVQSNQSWNGLSYAVRKLGADRLHRGLSQAEVMLVHALIPELPKDQREDLVASFAESSEGIFMSGYYLEPEGARDETLWYTDDARGESSPDHPYPILYRVAFSQNVVIQDLIDGLDSAKDVQEFCSSLVKRVNGSMQEMRE
jgi:ATPases involved in chromosome partitioning